VLYDPAALTWSDITSSILGLGRGRFSTI